MKKNFVKSLDKNLPFVSEVLQADIRLFVKDKDNTYLYNYYRPSHDSLNLNFKRGQKIDFRKDITVQKAFDMNKSIIGQYGLVINNRPVQEFAYPIANDGEVFAVVAVERDLYLTRATLGQYWDYTADILIKALKEKMHNGKYLPHISPGEGGLLMREDPKYGKVVFFVGPLATTFLSEIAESAQYLENRTLDDLFIGYKKKLKANNPKLSIETIEEIDLSKKVIVLRHISLAENIFFILVKDISELKIKETLLKEIHHRVKNNLQTVVSLLRMQTRRNPTLKNAFGEAISRIKGISLVHEFLSKSDDIESVDFGHLVSEIIKGLIMSCGLQDLELDFHCPQKVYINSEQATKLALVVNELVSNSLEHGGPELSKISVKLFIKDEHIHLNVKDDGKGFPEDFDYKSSDSLGWEIIRTLTGESLGAKILVDKGIGKGAKIKLEIPL